MKTLEYKNFGKCALLEKDGIKMYVTLDIGPRIIYYGTDDINFMNEDISRNVQKGGEWFDENYKAGEKWYLYGGHRTWKAPEDMETYVTDNYPVEVKEDGEFISFSTAPTKWGLSYGFSVKLEDGGAAVIKNFVKNHKEDRKIAIWSLSVVCKGGTLYIRRNEVKSEYQPSNNLVIWPYNDFNDERFRYGKKIISLKQTEKAEAFKFGIFSDNLTAYYGVFDKFLKISYEKKQGEFCDFGANFESYTNGHILEIEALGDYAELKRGEVVSLCERWEILSKDNKEIQSLLEDAKE